MANKSATIKNATDQELNDLLIRLRKETDAQQLIRNLKRGSTPDNQYNYQTDMSVSTETPIEDLYHEDVDKILMHFGIPGMHWHHRKHTNLFSKRMSQINEHEAKRTGKDEPEKPKPEPEPTSKKTKAKPPNSEDYDNYKELKSKNYKTLSNAELKKLNERMQLEKSMRDLKAADMQKGLDKVKALTSAGKTMSELYNLSKSPFGQAIQKGLAKKFKRG